MKRTLCLALLTGILAAGSCLAQTGRASNDAVSGHHPGSEVVDGTAARTESGRVRFSFGEA